MRDKIMGAIGVAGFFIAAGAGGGIECDTMGWGPGLAVMAAGLCMVLGAFFYYRRRA